MPRAPLARHFVAAALHEDQLQSGVRALELVDGFEIHRRILPDRGVRTAARLDAADAVRRQRSLPDQELRVFERVDVFVTTARLTEPVSAALRRSTRAVLPVPTGPATPILNARASFIGAV